MLVEDGGEFFCERFSSPKVGWECGIDGTGGEKFLLCLQTLLHWDVVGDVFLTSVLNAHVPVSQWNLLVFQDVSSIVSAIHDVYLGQTTDRSLTRGINLPHNLECLTHCQVLIGRYDTEDDRSRF